LATNAYQEDGDQQTIARRLPTSLWKGLTTGHWY